MKKVKLIIKIIMSIPKTIYFNLRVFDLKTAIRFPIFISNNIKLQEIYKGCIKIDSKKINTFMIKIGIAGSDAIESQRGLIFLNKKIKGKIIFHGEAKFSEGIKLYNNSGVTEFGDNFIANKNCFIASDKKIVFGQNVLIGWNVNIRDSDGHKIVQMEKGKENYEEVNIGNHVWICSYVDILKGNSIGNDCVIAYRSCLTGITAENNKLIGGYPAKVVKDNINWEK